MPERIQRKRTKGWTMPEGAVYVGRPTVWGNPFVVGEDVAHRHRATTDPRDFYVDHHRVNFPEQAVRLFERIITDPTEHSVVGHETPTVDAIRAELAGKDLACWCPLDQPCHADVLLRIANTMTDAEVDAAMGEVRAILDHAARPWSHWLTRFDPADGEPYGEVCTCPHGDDHTLADLECTCAMTESSMWACARHGEKAPAP